MALPILAVDDSAPIREMINAVLSPRGYEVTMASNGHEALATLRAMTQPHIVLLDVVMPGIDGLAVIREMGNDIILRNAGHRVVLMSLPLRLAARDIPPTADQLAKPFTRQQLIEIIERLSH